MDFFEAAAKRYSHRANYTNAPVPEADLVKIVTAGLQAPSGGNKQTTDFIIVTNPDIRRELSNILVCDAIRTAPAIIVGLTKYDPFDFGLAFEVEDYSAAVQNILLAATALGYASCWFDGTTRLDGRDKKMATLLGVAENYSVRTLLPIGVPENHGLPASRKPFSERVRWVR